MSKPQRGKGFKVFFFFFSKKEGLISTGLITGIEKAIRNKILFAFTGL